MGRLLPSRCTLGLVLGLLLVTGVGPAVAGTLPQTAGAPRPAAAEPEALYDVIVNEWSQGHGGNQEWVELLVTAGPLDMRGWDLGDSTPGDLVFSNSPVWQNVPAGLLIVIYYGTEKDSSLPQDDTDFSDCVVVIPHSNLTYFSGSWPLFSNDTSADNPHLRDASDATVHDYSTAPGNTAALHPDRLQCTYYTSDTAAGVANAANWAADQPADNATPGVGNGGANTNWIASMGCGADQPPYVTGTSPAEGQTGVSRLANIVVEFSESVNVDSGWYGITCTLSGVHTAAVSPSGPAESYTLNPDVDFTVGDHCTTRIYAARVHDQDLDDPPDTMLADFIWTFDVGADTAPSVASTTPPDGATGFPPGANLVVNFSENVDATGSWYNINCTSSGGHTAVASGGPQSLTLNPNVDFTPLEGCTVLVYASQVTDQDLDDPPDNMEADHSWSFTVGTAAPPPCGGAYNPIFAIQGSGGTAALTGNRTTQGIVVGDFQNTTTGLGGFFLQDPWTDSNAATSDGIFVYNSSYAVNVGDHVRLTGTVVEYGTDPNTLTEINSVTDLQVCGTGYTISPTPVTLPIPEGDALYLEKYEGMLVTWLQELYVTENYGLGRYGEVLLSSGGRLWNPTNVVSPGAPAVALQAANDRNRIILDDDNLTQNADPIDHPSPGLTAANTLRSGDAVTGLIGCLSQSFSEYRVHPTVAPPFVHANPRTTGPAAPGGTVTVASFNVLNYFNGDGQGGGFPTARGADSLAEFNRQRNKIIPAIVGLQADVIGLMEIENDSGDYQAIQDLVNGLNAMEGAGTYGFINTGVVGTDAIRVALIYRLARVTPVGAPMVDTNSINNRPTLAQTLQQNSTGEEFSVVVNHFKSKGCDGATGDDADQLDGQGCYNETRVQQATRLSDWINTVVIPGHDPDVIIIGDLNAYALEDPITTLTGLGYTNLTNRFEGTYAYSYVYMGQSGYLDHALATAGIVPQVAGTSHWHINPDEPVVLDYNVEFKTTNQQTILYSADAYRSSDHDPVLIGLYPFDFSDLATSYGTAWHGGNGALMLGSGWTADPTYGPETDNATDGGVTMEPTTGWAEGRTVRIYADVTGGSGYLAGWFDWNNDGDFADAQEKSLARTVSAGPNTIDFVIPTGAGYTTPGREVKVRFRLYPSEPGTLGTESPTGGTGSGEVEDSVWTPPAPTAVKLLSFTGRPAASGILLAWETATEEDNVGFNLYRSTTPGVQGAALNGALIPSQAPGSGQGAVYTFLDTTARPGTTYYYALEDIDISGTRTAHGPVTVTVWRAYLPVVD